jgi:hypothetical protein
MIQSASDCIQSWVGVTESNFFKKFSSLKIEPLLEALANVQFPFPLLLCVIVMLLPRDLLKSLLLLLANIGLMLLLGPGKLEEVVAGLAELVIIWSSLLFPLGLEFCLLFSCFFFSSKLILKFLN